MPLPEGSRFGPYRVTAQLGEGGMGQVYRANDTRLGRDVALKVLHSDVAQNPDRRARFEREARAVASLNHPNIVALFDFGEEEGIVYFVSELVEGESLRDRINRGPMSVRDLLDIAVQMADGMSAAHAAGITHRDLKPENVMLTREGRVKILDFGLARQAMMPSPAGNPPGNPDRTLTINETQPGAVLGTANYMSPEQVRGVAVDYRSDQFSLGIVLYEMATGRQAFARESAVLTMSAVVTDDPPHMEPAIQAKLPAPLRWTMQRCLAKEPTRRYESTRDLYEDLRAQREHLAESFSSGVQPALPDVPAPAIETPQTSGMPWKIACAALLVVTLALAGLLMRGRKSAGVMTDYRFTPFAISSEAEGSAVWSRDGKAAAYLRQVDGVYQVFVRYLDSEVPLRLTTTGAGGLYGWSADSQRVFFRGPNPGKNGHSDAVFSVAAVGGDPQLLTAIDAIASDISPDGKTLAIYRQDKDGYCRVYISSPIGGPLTPYPSEKFTTRARLNTPRLRFAPDGKNLLLFLRAAAEKRWLLPYPASQGQPREVLAALPQYGFTPSFSWFPDSHHIVVSITAHTGEPANLWIADIDSTRMRRLTATPSTNQHLPSVSPDGRKILYQEIDNDMDLAKVALTDGKVIRLMGTERQESMPAWAAHTGKFAWVTDRNGPPEIWIRDEDGAEKPLVTPANFAPVEVNFFMNPTLSPDADRVIYTMGEAGGRTYLYISAPSGGSPIRVTNTDGGPEFAGSLSPDGRQLAYIGLGGGNSNLMIVKTSGQATPTRLKDNTYNALPQWSPTGEWITFEDKDGWHLISPDGKTVRDLGQIGDTSHLAFSRDGKKLYGIRSEKDHEYLFSLEVNGDRHPLTNIADVGEDYAPASEYNPGYRLSVAPDGTCAIYTVGTYKSSIWLFEGFGAP